MSQALIYVDNGQPKWFTLYELNLLHAFGYGGHGGPKHGWTAGQLDRQMYACMNRQMVGQTDTWTDVGCLHGCDNGCVCDGYGHGGCYGGGGYGPYGGYGQLNIVNSMSQICCTYIWIVDN